MAERMGKRDRHVHRRSFLRLLGLAPAVGPAIVVDACVPATAKPSSTASFVLAHTPEGEAVALSAIATPLASGHLAIRRGSAVIAMVPLNGVNFVLDGLEESATLPTSLYAVDHPGPGCHTYTATCTGGGEVTLIQQVLRR